MRKATAEGYLRLIEEHLAGAVDHEKALGNEATVAELGRILRTSDMTLCHYRKERSLVEYRRQGNACVYRLGHTKEQLERVIRGDAPPENEFATDAQKSQQVAHAISEIQTADKLALPVVHQHVHLHTSPEDLFARTRERAMKEAKESYRDVILEAADAAEKRGDSALANRFYKDFIHMEEGLKVIYEGK